MMKFLKLLWQTAFLISALYLIASVGAIMIDWLLADYSRAVAMIIVALFISGRILYKEVL
jgi:hypothetical protein